MKRRIEGYSIYGILGDLRRAFSPSIHGAPLD
jgi:hypothetical protein